MDEATEDALREDALREDALREERALRAAAEMDERAFEHVIAVVEALRNGTDPGEHGRQKVAKIE